MPLNVRIDGDLAILSQFGSLLNDPRHFDASRELKEYLDQGCRNVVFDLKGLREVGPTGLGLLTTLTRLVRNAGGEAVLANAGRDTAQSLELMKLDAYWDLFASVADAKAFFRTEEP